MNLFELLFIAVGLSMHAFAVSLCLGLKPLEMLPLALATSIDALAVGITFAFLKVTIVPAVSFIGLVTFTLSVAGVLIGNLFGARFKSKAEFTGGIILVCLGLKILLQHLGILA